MALCINAAFGIGWFDSAAALIAVPQLCKKAVEGGEAMVATAAADDAYEASAVAPMIEGRPDRTQLCSSE